MYLAKAKLHKLAQLFSQMSVKRMTVLGFALVMVPLFVTLIYMAEQTKVAANQGAKAILTVSSLIDSNRTLNQTLRRTERFASQYLVLKDEELLDRFSVEQFKLNSLIDQQQAKFGDEQLNVLLTQLSTKLNTLGQQLPQLPAELDELQEIERAFLAVHQLGIDIRQRSEQIIQQTAHSIRNQANDVDSVILKSLIIVPISLLIAAIFIFLITAPLKRLTLQINQLERGQFEQKFNVSGSQEVLDIAHALETMRTRLHALELQKSSFIRHISHELKTPLAAIREGSALLSDHSLGALNSGQQEVSDIIVANVNRLQQLIEDLLAFNVVLDSTSLQDAEAIELKPLIEDIVAQHKLVINRHHLATAITVENIGIDSNRKQLSVIIENLLSNAIKYQPDHGKIVITAKLEQNRLVLSVADSGNGISEQALPYIFDAFYQGQREGDNSIKSSGLGLTIVKELIMRLNGNIEVQSRSGTNANSATTGTVFTVTLPHAYLLEAKQ